MVSKALSTLVLLVAMFGCLSATSLEYIRTLLEELERGEGIEADTRDLDQQVSDIVERVFSPQLQSRYTRANGDSCGKDDDGNEWFACMYVVFMLYSILKLTYY